MDKVINRINITAGLVSRPVGSLSACPRLRSGFAPAGFHRPLAKTAPAMALRRVFSVPAISQRRCFLQFAARCRDVAVWLDGRRQELTSRDQETARVYLRDVAPNRPHVLTLGLGGGDVRLTGPVVIEQSIEVCNGQEYAEPLSRGRRFWAAGREQSDPFAVRKYVDIGGVPFRVDDWSDRLPAPALVTPCGAIPPDLPGVKETRQIALGGVSARYVYLLGMISGYDCGTGSWYRKGDDISQEQFLGDSLGQIAVRYADGSGDLIPLIFGFTAFWYGPIVQGLGVESIYQAAPFDKDPAARADLDRCLFLNAGYPEPRLAYVLRFQPAAKPIRAMTIRPNGKLLGRPVIEAITVQADRAPEVLQPLPSFPAAGREWRTLTRRDLAKSIINRRIRKLQSHLYTFQAETRRRFALSLPQGLVGPRLRLAGDGTAEMMTNIFHHSLHATAKMVADDGTSTVLSHALPNWGPYRHAIGCFTRPRRKGFPSRYPIGGLIWSRDAGRAVMELARCGFHRKALAAADLWDRHIDLCRPPHWTRYWAPACTEMPMETLDGCRYLGQPENTGHALLALARYKAWHWAGRDADWLSEHWKATTKAAEWIIWQLEHPTLRGQPKGTIFTTGEVGTGWQDVYTNSLCLAALRACAEMAEKLGEIDSARRWRRYARLMARARKRHLVETRRGRETWRFIRTDDRYRRLTDWRSYGQSLGPLIVAADIDGFDTRRLEADLLSITANTLTDRLAEAVPPYCFAGAMGYGQGFITQAALLLDQTHHAEQLLRAIAKYVYHPSVEPWIVPEGTAVHPSGRYWYRLGMFANQVQIAEILKVFAVMLGIDDAEGEVLKILPRIPAAWSQAEVRDYPAATSSDGRIAPNHIAYRLDRSARGIRLAIRADRPVDRLCVRLGPFAARPAKAALSLRAEQPPRRDAAPGNKPLQARAVKSGDAYWLWLDELRHLSEVEISCRL